MSAFVKFYEAMKHRRTDNWTESAMNWIRKYESEKLIVGETVFYKLNADSVFTYLSFLSTTSLIQSAGLNDKSFLLDIWFFLENLWRIAELTITESIYVCKLV